MTIKQLVTHADERGFFREIIRNTDEIFKAGFGQLSHSMMHTGTIKAWHLHMMQHDWWYVPIGVIRAVTYDFELKQIEEFLLGDNQQAQVLHIPPGYAHGLKVLQGPAHLFYITSKVYNPEDELRLPYNDENIDYDWLKEVEIK